MIKEQAEAFLNEMAVLELMHPGAFDKYGSFKTCVFIFRSPDILNELDIKPLKGIEKDTALWDEIRTLFHKIKMKNIR